MIPYTPPLQDFRFILRHLIGLDRLAALPGDEEISPDLVDSVLEAAGALASESFAPLNRPGDRQGARMIDGKVVTPDGYKDAYRAFADGGWNALPFAPEIGGQGLPWCVAMPVQEMFQAANLALALCTLLNQGAVELLEAHGSENLKARYLPKLVSGDWAGTMNITESQAGSDVGGVRCKAARDGDRFRISGQKIFISYGDHDLTENIVHFVLARIEGAPEGSRGLSLFLVPKILVNEDGGLGAPNDVRAVSLEHKLGQHGSPTCVMAYGDQGGAQGWLVGEENAGLAAMFTMMNNARVGVGVQGLALAERAYQQALAYAQTRVQGRFIGDLKGPAVPIMRHPDVARMLLSMKSQIEAARALAMDCAFFNDVARRGANETARQKAQLRVDLLMPIIKVWLTDMANEVTSTGVQVHGGMGYVEETGAAQHMRDARVLAIYEGSNGIQANDLAFRKLARDQGQAVLSLLDEAQSTVVALGAAGDDDFAVIKNRLSQALVETRKATLWMTDALRDHQVAAAASAVPYLKLVALTLGGHAMARMGLATLKAAADEGQDFLAAKRVAARFYADHILPQVQAVTVTDGYMGTLALNPV